MCEYMMNLSKFMHIEVDNKSKQSDDRFPHNSAKNQFRQ